jgi:hypothetical protein
MKKLTILAATFLLVFGMTLGVLLSFNEDANAIGLCSWRCGLKMDWTHQTGELCPGTCPASDIYYVYLRSTCIGGPLNCPWVNNFSGCWDGTIQFACIP